MRRNASNTFSSCSAASDSNVRRLAGELRAGRVDPLAVRREHLGDRMLSEPVDLEIRTQLAQLRGDRDVPARVAETDRRGDVERAPASASGRGSSSAVAPAGEMRSRSSRFTTTGSRAFGMCPEPSSVTSAPPVALASASPCACGRIRSRSPWITSVGQRTRATRGGELLAARDADPARRVGAASREWSRAPTRCSPRSAWSSGAR